MSRKWFGENPAPPEMMLPAWRLAMQEYLQWHATGIDVHNEGGAALYVTTAIECVATASITAPGSAAAFS